VYVWIVNVVDEMYCLFDFGVDGLISDCLDMMCEVLMVWVLYMV